MAYPALAPPKSHTRLLLVWGNAVYGENGAVHRPSLALYPCLDRGYHSPFIFGTDTHWTGHGLYLPYQKRLPMPTGPEAGHGFGGPRGICGTVGLRNPNGLGIIQRQAPPVLYLFLF